MFWKLFKHEMKSSYRTFMFAYAAFLICTLLLAIGGRWNVTSVSQEGNGIYMGTLSGSDHLFAPWMDFLLGAMVLLYILTMGIVMAVTCINIVRGYKKSMFDHDAYLTHTLPVTQWQLMLVKVLAALTWIFASFLISMLSFAILAMGMLLKEMQRGLVPFFDLLRELIVFGFTHKEVYMILYLIIADLLQIITLIYCIINLTHSAYVHHYRVVMGIVLFVGVCLLQSGLEDAIESIGILSHSDMLQNLAYGLYYLAFSAVWFFASVYLLKHKMEVE